MDRYDEMYKQFLNFHSEHPEVWEFFQKFAFDRIRKGFEHYSANGIFERIRWELSIPEYGDNEFKLNNNYRPFYARWFMEEYPAYNGFFRIREQTSIGAPATNLDPLGPEYFE